MKKRPLLIDLNGVLKIGNSPPPDVKEFFDFINENQIPACILSNSTLRTGDLVKEFFASHKIELLIPAITAFDAALSFVKKNYKKVQVYCRNYLIHHFEGLIDEDNPEAIVIGDIEDQWNYRIINDIFKKVFTGVDLVAMHMNRFWSPEKDKHVLDAGSYISAIEYATEKKATLIGKPSPIYYQTALEILGFAKNTPFLMLGDDLELDITPVQKMGGKSILILTGKTKLPIPDSSSPDFIAENLFEVTGILKKIYSLD